jgi:hypothetical protein
MTGQFGKKLLRRQTGTSWNNEKDVIFMDNEWWRKAKLVSNLMTAS